eukprot:TRINITY_DN29414_c0_g1_i1.p1 TRINITY_DN29414_c0_g1~~TRINITY_DN29414_c0_g1_i1.p1  ORF type:complete len:1066 (+),score=190.94 TRINITY_DN29414_c0_g1_i1:45-3242(+)
MLHQFLMSVEPLVTSHREDRWHGMILPWTLVWPAGMPATSAANLWFCYLQGFAMIYCLAVYGAGERWQNVDPAEIFHVQIAACLLVPIVVVEASFLLTAISDARDGPEGPSTQLSSLRQSSIPLVHYFVKLTTVMAIALLSGGIVHTDTLGLAGPRGFCTIRNIQWSLACPLIMIISNDSVVRGVNPEDARKRDWPSLVNCFLYCWTSWAAAVCPAPMPVKWGLLWLSLLSFIIVSADQVALYRSQAEMQQPVGQGILLSYQIACFLFYGIVYLLSRVGVLNPFLESIIYSYGDVTVKLFHGAINVMVRSREDTLVMRHWWSTAARKGDDLERLMKCATVPILSMTLDGHILFWNQQLVTLTGISEEAAKGQNFVEVVSPASQAAVEEAIATRTQEAIHVSIDKDGDEVKLILKFVVQNSKEAEPVGLTVIGQDLTEVTMLRETEERQARMSGILSHELKSPLHGIIGLSSVMMQTECNPSKLAHLEMMRNSATRLRDMVSDIMEMAAQHELRKRHRDASVDLAVEKTNILSIVNEVVCMTQCAVNRANKPLINEHVKLVNTCPSTAPAVMGNHSKLTQLIYNLVTNACKFTKAGTVTVSCRKSGNEVLVDVQDTGPGIDPEALQRIFRPFEQDSSNKNKHFEGIGLGLSIAHSIAKAHRGRISVQSKLGMGSTFTLHMPALAETVSAEILQIDDVRKANQPALPQQPRAPQTVVAKPVVNKKIADDAPLKVPSLRKEKSEIVVLSVDDCEVNQTVIKGALSNMATVHHAMNGQEALDWLENNGKPDLVLLDVMMPVLAGFETLEIIRKCIPRWEMPIMMISANSEAERQTIKALSCGADEYITKPASADALRARVAARILLTEQWQERIRASLPQAALADKYVQTSGDAMLTLTKPTFGDSLAQLKDSPRPEERMQEVNGKDIHVQKIQLVSNAPPPLANGTPDKRKTGSSIRRRSPERYNLDDDMSDDEVNACHKSGSHSETVERLLRELRLRDESVAALAKALEASRTAALMANIRNGALSRQVGFMETVAESSGCRFTKLDFLQDGAVDDFPVLLPALFSR